MGTSITLNQKWTSKSNVFLPPTTVVAWKVMFSQACVIPSAHLGSTLCMNQYAMGRGCIPAWGCLPGGVCLGVSVQGDSESGVSA